MKCGHDLGLEGRPRGKSCIAVVGDGLQLQVGLLERKGDDFGGATAVNDSVPLAHVLADLFVDGRPCGLLSLRCRQRRGQAQLLFGLFDRLAVDLLKVAFDLGRVLQLQVLDLLLLLFLLGRLAAAVVVGVEQERLDGQFRAGELRQRLVLQKIRISLASRLMFRRISISTSRWDSNLSHYYGNQYAVYSSRVIQKRLIIAHLLHGTIDTL